MRRSCADAGDSGGPAACELIPSQILWFSRACAGTAGRCVEEALVGSAARTACTTSPESLAEPEPCTAAAAAAAAMPVPAPVPVLVLVPAPVPCTAAAAAAAPVPVPVLVLSTLPPPVCCAIFFFALMGPRQAGRVHVVSLVLKL